MGRREGWETRETIRSVVLASPPSTTIVATHDHHLHFPFSPQSPSSPRNPVRFIFRIEEPACPSLVHLLSPVNSPRLDPSAYASTIMESFSLDHLPAELRNVHVGLFQNVKNAQELKTNLVAAAVNPDAHDERERLDFSFIEAKTVRKQSPFLVQFMTRT